MQPTHTPSTQSQSHQAQIQAQPLSRNQNTKAHNQIFSTLEPRSEMHIKPTLDPQAQSHNQTHSTT